MTAQDSISPARKLSKNSETAVPCFPNAMRPIKYTITSFRTPRKQAETETIKSYPSAGNASVYVKI